MTVLPDERGADLLRRPVFDAAAASPRGRRGRPGRRDLVRQRRRRHRADRPRRQRRRPRRLDRRLHPRPRLRRPTAISSPATSAAPRSGGSTLASRRLRALHRRLASASRTIRWSTPPAAASTSPTASAPTTRRPRRLALRPRDRRGRALVRPSRCASPTAWRWRTTAARSSWSRPSPTRSAASRSAPTAARPAAATSSPASTACPTASPLDDAGDLYISLYHPSRILRVAPRRHASTIYAEDPTAHVFCHPTNIAFDGPLLYTANLGRWHITEVGTDTTRRGRSGDRARTAPEPG